jgi:hypothetical protein
MAAQSDAAGDFRRYARLLRKIYSATAAMARRMRIVISM